MPDIEDDSGPDPVKQHQHTPCCSRLICMMLVGVMITGSVVALSLAFTGNPNPYNYFVAVDPPGRNEAVRWDASAGLYLTVENACQDFWTPYFDESILEWNKTDALILRSEKVSYDFECSARPGRLKVCNGDYGQTDWKGLNTALIDADRDVVVHSVSKLNDYFLTTDIMRRYTMCHENGHGFGLPHTDEDHLNRDRGDCMDYTTRPENNLLPGDFNFELLQELYGTPEQPLTDAPIASSTVAPTDPNESSQFNGPPYTSGGSPYNLRPNEKDKEKEKEKDKEKKDDEEDRQRILPEEMIDSLYGIKLREMQERYDAEIQEMVDSCTKDHCVYKLDDQYSILVSKLLA